MHRTNFEKDKIIAKIIASKQNTILLIKSDLTRYHNLTDAFFSFGFWAVFLYRVSHFFHTHRLDFFGKIIQLISHIVIGCEISRKAVIGPNFSIYHPEGVFVGPNVHFGQGIILGQGCFLGTLNKIDDPNDVPALDDYVNVSTGAKLFGNIFIGERSIIGPNVVVVRNIPANHTVLPAQYHVIKKYELRKKAAPIDEINHK